ncbi:hypothetical protein GCM10009755_15830 [Brevibacterium samyangense]|uniref:Uncharacterized protein n=1 Tax=Brevibacterium samyangense TaxID=366888 RepID=A0ABP5EXW0_9MICO
MDGVPGVLEDPGHRPEPLVEPERGVEEHDSRHALTLPCGWGAGKGGAAQVRRAGGNGFTENDRFGRLSANRKPNESFSVKPWEWE